jgi:hypothetical protein
MFGGCGFQKAVDISLGTNYVPFPADLFLYLYKLDIMLGLLKSRPYNFTIHNIHYAHCMYLTELEIKDTTDIARSTSYLDLHIDINSESRVKTKLKDKRDDYNFLL